MSGGERSSLHCAKLHDLHTLTRPPTQATALRVETTWCSQAFYERFWKYLRGGPAT
jgi:hypothetical protein